MPDVGIKVSKYENHRVPLAWVSLRFSRRSCGIGERRLGTEVFGFCVGLGVPAY